MNNWFGSGLKMGWRKFWRAKKGIPVFERCQNAWGRTRCYQVTVSLEQLGRNSARLVVEDYHAALCRIGARMFASRRMCAMKFAP